MVNLAVIVLRIVEKSNHLAAVSVSKPNGEGSEVLVKWVVSEFLVGIKVKGIVVRSWWLVT